jgi:hypothetical protein
VTQARILYRHNQAPRRGLAATGVFFVKWILAIPHLFIIGALQGLAQVLAYIGYWIVALTGTYPRGLLGLIDLAFHWSARTWGWIAGISDDYPPFEPEPRDYPVGLELPRPDTPAKGWAVAGIFVFPKLFALLPHVLVLIFVNLAAAVAMWFGYLVAMFTGRLPAGIQDFLASTLQWNARIYAWLVGLTDEYPPFRLDAMPLPDRVM